MFLRSGFLDIWKMFLGIFQDFDVFEKMILFENPKSPVDTVFLYVTHSKSPFDTVFLYITYSKSPFDTVFLVNRKPLVVPLVVSY